MLAVPPLPPVTVSPVKPDMLPEVAVMVVLPFATGVASPFEPAALLMVPTDVTEELHVTDDVRFCVLLSEKVPVAVNCWVVPKATTVYVGVTAIDTSVGLTVRVVEPEMLPDVAVIIVVPGDTDDAFPLEPDVLLIVATDTFDELHVTDVVRF